MKTKLKIRDSVYVLKENKEDYVFIFTSTRKIKKFSTNGLVRACIDALDSEKNEGELVKQLSEEHDIEEIGSCLDTLEFEGIIQRYQNNQIEERYSRQIQFLNELTNSWEETLELQKKLRNSKVVVFGVGGIGTWIVNGLYQIGIGEIRISDPDVVEESNLNRQLFFDSQDIGQYKVEVISSKLRDAKIIEFKKIVSPEEDLEEIVKGCDFLVNCADSPSIVDTTRVVNIYAAKHKIPYCVSGGYNLHLGMVGPIIIPGKTKTFEDFIRYQKKVDPFKDFEMVKDINQTGNLGPIAGAIANIQVMEIFKYLIGKGELNLNRFAEIDFMDLNVSWREF